MSDIPTEAAWLADPTGRHAQRYFDGQQWTEHVADAGGNASVDPFDAPEPAAGGPAPASETMVVPSDGAQDAGGAPLGGQPAASATPGAGSPDAGAGASPVEEGVDPTTVTGPGGGINQPDPTLAYGAGEASQATQAVPPGGAAPPPPGAGWGGPAAAPPPGAAAPPPGAPAPPPGAAAPPWGAPAPPGGPAAAPPAWNAPPPGAAAPPAYAQPAPPAYGAPAPAYGAPAPSYGTPVAVSGAKRGPSPVGLVGAVIGLVLILVGFFAVNWYAVGGQGIKLSDLSKAAGDPTPDLIGLTKVYFRWGVWLALVIAVVGSVLAGLVRKLAWLGLILSLLALAWHLWAIFDLKHYVHVETGITYGFQAGVWLAAAGFLVCAIASLIPGRRKSAV